MTHEHGGDTKVCEYPACVENPKTATLLKIQKIATAVNGVMGLTLSVVGVRVNSPAALADGIHSVTDTAAHYGHVSTLKNEQKHAKHGDSRTFQGVTRARVLTAALIGAGAFYSGYQTVEAVQNPEDVSFSKVAFGAESAAAIVGAGMLLGVRKYHDGSKAAVDTERHIATDTTISTLAAGSILLTEYVDWSQPVVSAAATALTARLALKTATGNNHDH